MAFDRSKYKGANLDKAQEKRKKVEKKLSFKKSDRPVYHSIEPGNNVFRILPAHDQKHLPFEEVSRSFLKCETDVYENGEPTGKKEVRKKAIFNAKIHGENLPDDPVDIYIKYVYRFVYDQTQDKAEHEQLLAPITGYMNKGKFVGGIRPNTSYMYYAIKDGQIGFAEFNYTIDKRMQEISFGMQSDDEPENIDIFSDPDEGVNLEIYKDTKAKKATERYVVNKAEYNPKKWKSYEEFIESMRISDEVLEKFSKMKPLHEIFRGVYTTRDFDFALDGLQRFDQENGYEIFENEEFLDELEELHKLIPEYTPKDKGQEADEVEDDEDDVQEEEETPKKTIKKIKKKVVVEEEPEEEVDEEGETEEVPKDDIAARLAALRKKNKK